MSYQISLVATAINAFARSSHGNQLLFLPFLPYTFYRQADGDPSKPSLLLLNRFYKPLGVSNFMDANYSDYMHMGFFPGDVALMGNEIEALHKPCGLNSTSLYFFNEQLYPFKKRKTKAFYRYIDLTCRVFRFKLSSENGESTDSVIKTERLKPHSLVIG